MLKRGNSGFERRAISGTSVNLVEAESNHVVTVLVDERRQHLRVELAPGNTQPRRELFGRMK